MYIICGLGNPGKKYEKTRHNIGFVVLDRIAEKAGISIGKMRFRGLTGEGQIAGQKVLLLKPQTYMNLSGESLREAAAYYKVPPEQIIVIYDDFDIPAGSLRIRKFGSAGTHNGMRSCVQELGSEAFPRIRVGTGGDGKDRDVIGFVIGGFSKAERDALTDVVENAADACFCMLEQGADIAMNRYNTKKHGKADE